jgi:hypothetical protein
MDADDVPPSNITATTNLMGNVDENEDLRQAMLLSIQINNSGADAAAIQAPVAALRVNKSRVQFGFVTDGFNEMYHHDDHQLQGVGADEDSWGVCGIRRKKYHQRKVRSFGSEWSVGDIIGFALDMRTAGAAVMSVSLNGSFDAPNGVAFSGINAAFLTPAFTGKGGQYRLNFGDRPFVHPPSDAAYVSVHNFHRTQQPQ